MTESTPLDAQIEAHISKVELDPSIALDERLFDSCTSLIALHLTQQPEKLTGLIARLSGLLPTLQQDPAPVIRLLSKLIEPLSFNDVLTLQPPVDFEAGLSRGALPFNLLVLKIIRKAAASARDAAILAGMPSVVHALVTLWLSTSDVGVADMSAAVLIDLLRIDKEPSSLPLQDADDDKGNSRGQGLMWRRVFGDKDVYGLLYSLPSQKLSLNNNSGNDLNRREKSLAQARLMTIIPQLGALDWDHIARSHHREIESRFGLKADEGLLHFVCEHLIDYQNDVLLHINQLQFFAELISTVKIPSTSNPHQSVSLDFLQRYRLHERATSYWLNPDDRSHDPADLSFLYGPSADYIAAFARTYPSAFLSSPLRAVQQRLARSLDQSAGKWAQEISPKHDLIVLNSVPRVALLPQAYLGAGRQTSPLLLIPCKVTNEDALYSLAEVLGGPRDIQSFPVNDAEVANTTQEKQAARLLFHIYLHYHDTFFADLVNHADTIALPDKARAALALLCSIMSSKWAALPSTSTSGESASATTLPTESQLTRSILPSPYPSNFAYTYPPTGMDVLLRQPARDKILPYLLKPPRQFANLVGGRGDTESAAYKVAVAKWDCFLLFKKRLEEYVPARGSGHELGLDAVKDAVTLRMREGVWGTAGDIGGRVATLEL